VDAKVDSVTTKFSSNLDRTNFRWNIKKKSRKEKSMTPRLKRRKLLLLKIFNVASEVSSPESRSSRCVRRR
jgi:hypothetical protein